MEDSASYVNQPVQLRNTRVLLREKYLFIRIIIYKKYVLKKKFEFKIITFHPTTMHLADELVKNIFYAK